MSGKISISEAAYIAGIVDGEGYVSIYKRKNKACRQGISYTAGIVVVNTSQKLTDWLQKITGVGNVHGQVRKKHKKIWRWQVQAKQVVPLLETILPYLVIKPEQAKCVLEFCKTVKNPGRKGLTADQMEYREKAYLHLKSINLRGIK